MPSVAYRRWVTIRAKALDEIEQAHAAVGGTGPGRRTATQQLNQAYAIMLAAQFQGFCRDLHTECIDHYLAAITAPPVLHDLVQTEFKRNRFLDRGNAHPGSLGADFGRLGIKFWTVVEGRSPRHAARKELLAILNDWRNAIVHQDFDPTRLGGTTALQLAQVRRWRAACRHLARAFDDVMREHVQTLTGASPW